MRGLDALQILNLRDGASVSEVVQEIHLPRTTVYRILETLCDSGFVHRDPSDDRYRLTIQVRGLSDRFDDEEWVAEIAKPIINEFSREVVWPLAIATPSGTSMLVRESTDHASPLAVERYPAGYKVPLLTSAGGLVYLANCPVAQRDALLDSALRNKGPAIAPAPPRQELLRRLQEIRAQGYSSADHIRPAAQDLTLSVPVVLEERTHAALTIRIASSAMTLPAAVGRFLPKLRECANKIRTAYSEQRAEARRHAATATAI